MNKFENMRHDIARIGRGQQRANYHYPRTAVMISMTDRSQTAKREITGVGPDVCEMLFPRNRRIALFSHFCKDRNTECEGLYRLRIEVVRHGEIKTMGFIRSVITRLYTRATVRVVAGVLAIRNYLDKKGTPTHGLAAGSLKARSHPAPLRYCTTVSNPLSHGASNQPAACI